jgi:hypothetical protein
MSNLLLSTSDEDRADAVRWYKSVIDLAAAAGAQGVGGHVGALSVASVDSRERPALIAAQRDAMLELAEHAGYRGLTHLQFENLAAAAEYGHSIEEAHELEHALSDSAVPWVLCLDVGHPPALGAHHPSHEVEDWFQQEWLHTPVVQLQQSALGSDRHAPFTAETATWGQVDPVRVMRWVERWGVSEVFMFLEVIPAHESEATQVLSDLKTSVQVWRDAGAL